MELGNGLFQQQGLRLSMTQELSQAIALLQYSSQELASFLEERAVENPLVQLEPVSSYVGGAGAGRRRQREQDASYWLEQIGGPPVSLHDYLWIQVGLQNRREDEKRVLKGLILNLDQNGYLRADLSDVAGKAGCDTEMVERCLGYIQGLEPAGVGARSLQECLLLQAERMTGAKQHAEAVLREHFMLFADKRWKDLAKKLGITLQDIQEVQDFVLTLNPRPGAAFQSEKPAYAVPDVKVEHRDGRLQVALVERGSGWSLNQDYYEFLKSSREHGVGKFLQEKWQEYQWISKSLLQRRETILRVTKLIVEKQEHCFRKGLASLKPMTMKEVADELGIHESTVSRAVRDKFVQAPFGTVELRAFFSAQIQSVSSGEMSAEAVKRELVGLIESEEKTRPLSDQDLSDILKKEKGILLSRRTVAKYRDLLNIPSSSKRKRY
ncbi:RNA polymerase factor sigma-54 [Peribacillus sp. SCS-37]|uniref:RNA polymerase factor sigma-54 n=1 Tax=Paraperibacillus esterisolvens TaxID=3115296 RepID=UPI003905846E